ncbi:Fatty acid desaturase [Perkinsus olseni]|uniref:Fatty acid desaturase n=2 Tax=Perkinsus olseni TaxID=32597 RepID=A0A7J6PJS9_PEROL|nr:Fatty acid desaturase [Perkinsus olseni]
MSSASSTAVQELLIDGRVYDVSKFIDRHPGGRIILFQVGTDATEAFREFHARSSRAQKILNSLPSREYDAKDDESSMMVPNKKAAAALRDFKSLREDLIKKGIFEPSIVHVLYRCLEALMWYALGFYLALCTNNVFIGCAILGVAQGRAGWLMHEGGHHSLTGHWKIDRFIQEFFFGVGCGMSAAWWRNAHNKHHAAPQHLGKDVDLETLPLVAFNRAVLRGRQPSTWLRYQSVLFAPVSTLLVSFFWQFYLHPRHILRTGRLMESVWISIRYSIIVYLAMIYGPLPVVLGYIMSVHIGGMYIFIHFAVSHTHLPVIIQGHATANASTPVVSWLDYASKHTMNVSTGNVLVTWLMSYLNYQIEHHLFPACPQFRFPGYVSKRVREFFAEHQLEYNEVGYIDAMRLTFSNLSQVASA